MITCRECIKEFALRGDDPRVRSGEYHLSSCDYCPKLDVERDAELAEAPARDSTATAPRRTLEPAEVSDLRKTTENLSAQIRYLQNKITELRAKKAKVDHY